MHQIRNLTLDSSPFVLYSSNVIHHDQPTDLEYVEDDFEEGAHKKLDEEIHQIFPLITMLDSNGD